MAKKSIPKQAPPQRKRRIYCDSCVFIAIFNNEADRCGICKQILADAQSGIIQIVTSTLALAECVVPGKAIVKGKNKDEDEDIDDPIPKFFDHEFIEMVNVDYVIAYQARRLQTDIKVAIKPHDAIHLATAATEATDMMFTYDKKLNRLNKHKALANLEICEPCRPWDSQLSMVSIEHRTVPDEYDLESEEETNDDE